ncbi:hypothetical protein CsSME_00003254 [Camellia sinensis var. sinensis]
MGSEGNKMSDSTSFQPSETKLYANGCGFFGVAAAMNLCSKCYKDFRITEEHVTSAKAAMDKLVNGFRVEIRAGSSSLAVKTAVESSAAVVWAAGVELVNQAETKAVNRCFSCKKKVGVLGFKCKCGLKLSEICFFLSLSLSLCFFLLFFNRNGFDFAD